jgi:hypothetical protein
MSVSIMWSEFSAQVGRVDRELEVDPVRAVGDPQLQPRRGERAAHAVRGGVLDERAHMRAAVVLREKVENRARWVIALPFGARRGHVVEPGSVWV